MGEFNFIGEFCWYIFSNGFFWPVMKPFTRERARWIERNRIFCDSVALNPFECEKTDFANRMPRRERGYFAALLISTLRKSKEKRF